MCGMIFVCFDHTEQMSEMSCITYQSCERSIGQKRDHGPFLKSNVLTTIPYTCIV